MTRHSSENVVSEQVFDQLVSAAEELSEPYRSECRFILYTAGRLGLRAGELCHMNESWVDWERSMINVPRFDPCQKGRSGGPCGYCKKRARSAVAHADGDLTMDEALAERWNPKTKNSARAVPFDALPETKAALEAFFMFHDGYGHSRASVNRRVDRVLDQAGLPRSTCFPHSLRASAASLHAYRGVNTASLKALFGWEKLATAEKYVRIAGGQTQEALRAAHGAD